MNAGPREQTTEPGELQKRIEDVLTAHPLIGTEHGNVACGRCHLVLGDPAQHLLAHLTAPEATETAQEPPGLVPDLQRWDRPIGGEGT